MVGNAITLTTALFVSHPSCDKGEHSRSRSKSAKVVKLRLFLLAGCKPLFTASCRQGSSSTLSTRRLKISPTQNRPCRQPAASTACPRRLRWRAWWCLRPVLGRQWESARGGLRVDEEAGRGTKCDHGNHNYPRVMRADLVPKRRMLPPI